MNRLISYISNFRFCNTKGIVLTLIKLFVFVSTFFLIIFLWLLPQYLYSYNASVIDKVNRLKELESPKIILVGNSNVAFGIRSEMIESEFDMPVVNLGIHGGLGNQFHENLIKGNINEGDLVVICHTDYSEDEADYVLTWVTIENHLELWKYVSNKEWINMVRAFPTYLKKCIHNQLAEIKNIKEYDECYSRLSFNEYGDNIYNESHEEHYEFAADYKSIAPEVDDGTVDRLNKLNDYVINNGGKMVIAGFPIAVDNEATREQYSDFELFQERLSSKLECEVISDFTDYFIDYDYYFNNKFHLSADGARLRTQKLIEDMNKKLR